VSVQEVTLGRFQPLHHQLAEPVHHLAPELVVPRALRAKAGRAEPDRVHGRQGHRVEVPAVRREAS